MNEHEYRRMIFEAAQGVNAVNRYIEHRLTLADVIEEQGFIDAAAEMRETWHEVWAALAGEPREILAEELHNSMLPLTSDEMDLVPSASS